MKDKMGTLQSSLNCERISTSLQSCFGFGSSPGQYETETSKKLPQHPPVSSNNESENVATLQPNKKVSNKRRSSKEICCCRSAELDEFPYDVCSPSPDSQLGTKIPSGSTCSSSMTQSRFNLPSARDRKSSDDMSSSCNTPDSAIQQAHSPLLLNGDSHGERTLAEAHNKQSSSISIERSVEETSHVTDSKERLVSVGSASDSGLKTTRVVEDSRLTMKNVIYPVAEKVTPNKAQDCDVAESIPISEKRSSDVTYFRDLVTSETSRLNESISKWSRVLQGGSPHCPVDVCDEIRTVIGQTKLVISERFSQFSKLIDRADGSGDLSSDERPVLLSDLQGFWDMIYFQVQDVDAKFNSLDQMQANQWKSRSSSATASKKVDTQTPSKPKAAAKKVPAKKKTQLSEEDKKRREAARKRIAEARKALASRNQIERGTNVSDSPPCPLSELAEDATQTLPTKDVASAEATQTTHRRPESIVDAVTCAVAHANNDSASISSISSTGLVHG